MSEWVVLRLTLIGTNDIFRFEAHVKSYYDFSPQIHRDGMMIVERGLTREKAFALAGTLNDMLDTHDA